jgi:DNA-binding NtrC family response regulator
VKGVSKEALELIMSYEWPGNVRELENLIERVIALTNHEYIQPEELPLPIVNQSKTNGLRESVLSGEISFSKAEEEFEKEIILDALRRAHFVQSHAAEILGISRRILKYKMDKLGIQQQERAKSIS